MQLKMLQQQQRNERNAIKPARQKPTSATNRSDKKRFRCSVCHVTESSANPTPESKPETVAAVDRHRDLREGG